MKVGGYKYFSEAEFAKATPSCSLSQMDDWFMQRLDKVRELAKVPMIVNSAFRSPQWEREHCRSGNSAHTYGMAVDIHCTDNYMRFRILCAAFEVGINRIGIGKNFIHLDDSVILPEPRVWLYE